MLSSEIRALLDQLPRDTQQEIADYLRAKLAESGKVEAEFLGGLEVGESNFGEWQDTAASLKVEAITPATDSEP